LEVIALGEQLAAPVPDADSIAEIDGGKHEAETEDGVVVHLPGGVELIEEHGEEAMAWRRQAVEGTPLRHFLGLARRRWVSEAGR
jgi:hypothetical protein